MNRIAVSHRWVKAADCVVVPAAQAGSLALHGRSTGQLMVLNPDEARLWESWNTDDCSTFEPLALKLASKGFARQEDEKSKPDKRANRIGEVSLSTSPCIKWHRESSDLTVIFHGGLMAQNNPLMVLGPYGSLCWRGITDGWSLDYIRREALRIFGADEVATFLDRLAALGFINSRMNQQKGPHESERIPKDFPAPEVQFQLRQSAVPWYCLWEMATACDLRCKICYLPGFTDRGPSKDAAKEIVEQIIKAGIFYVCLLGGEVLLRKDLEALVSQLRRSGVFVKIITNGQRLTPERASSLAAAGLNMVEVSFDGISKNLHELSRGPDTFERSIKALRHCREAGIPRLGSVITLHSGNIVDVEGIPQFLDDIGVTECYLSPFKKAGLNGSTALWEPPSPEQLQAIRSGIQTWRWEHPHLSITLLSSCSCGRTSVVIGANGDVRLCSFNYLSIGNIFELPLSSVWSSLDEARSTDSPLGYCSALRKVT